eukprot:1998323-Karenia_brevis.AAC.1
MVGENYDLKQVMQFITKSGTDFSTHTWAQVAKICIAHERIGKFVFETKPTRIDYEDMDQPLDAES